MTAVLFFYYFDSGTLFSVYFLLLSFFSCLFFPYFLGLRDFSETDRLFFPYFLGLRDFSETDRLFFLYFLGLKIFSETDRLFSLYFLGLIDSL